MGSTCSQRDSVPFRPPAGLSKAARGPRPTHKRPARTAEQLSTLESSFQPRRSLAPEVRLSEVQVRPGGRLPAVPLALRFPRR